jgi:hypothetical protein
MNDKHLAGLLLLSPDCSVTNHKTNFTDDAFLSFQVGRWSLVVGRWLVVGR